MANFSKTTWLILVLAFLLIIVGVFVYQWWQTKEELTKEVKEKEYIKEELASQIQKNEELLEIIEKRKEPSLEYCGKLIRFPISELGLFLTSSKAYIDVTNPIGEKIGGSTLKDIIENIKEGEPLPEWPLGTGDMLYSVADPAIEGGPPTMVILIHQLYNGSEGDYLIEISRKPDALPADTYTLTLRVSRTEGQSESITLADNLPFKDYPNHLYILRLTSQGIIPINPTVCGF